MKEKCQKEIEKEKIRKLFNWIKGAKSFIDNDMVDKVLLNKVIDHHINLIEELEDKVDFLTEMKYSEDNTNVEFFANKMIKEEDIIPALRYMMNKSDSSNQFLKYIVVRFLKLEDKIRKGLYEENFTMRTELESPLICRVTNKNWPKDIFHNLHSFIRFYNKADVLNEIMEMIDKDISNLIKDEVKLKQFKISRVIFGTMKEVTKNWSNWSMIDDPTCIDLFACKFFYRGEFRPNIFLDEVDKGVIPYDLIYKENQLIKLMIKNALHTISNNLNSSKTIKEMSESNENALKLLKRIKKYKIYFIDKEKLASSFEKHMENKGFKKDNPEIYKQYLEALLCLVNLNKEEEKLEKKQKM